MPASLGLLFLKQNKIETFGYINIYNKTIFFSKTTALQRCHSLSPLSLSSFFRFSNSRCSLSVSVSKVPASFLSLEKNSLVESILTMDSATIQTVRAKVKCENQQAPRLFTLISENRNQFRFWRLFRHRRKCVLLLLLKVPFLFRCSPPIESVAVF